MGRFRSSILLAIFFVGCSSGVAASQSRSLNHFMGFREQKVSLDEKLKERWCTCIEKLQIKYKFGDHLFYCARSLKYAAAVNQSLPGDKDLIPKVFDNWLEQTMPFVQCNIPAANTSETKANNSTAKKPDQLDPANILSANESDLTSMNSTSTAAQEKSVDWNSPILWVMMILVVINGIIIVFYGIIYIMHLRRQFYLMHSSGRRIGDLL